MKRSNTIYYNRKIFIGYVIREHKKTVVVEIKNKTKHRKYKKILNQISKYMVHDELNECCVGDFISFSQSKPYSRNKKWKVIKILKKNYSI